MWSTPLHLEGAEEEIFYVLAGSGRLRPIRRRGGLRSATRWPRATASSISRSRTRTRCRPGPKGSTSSPSVSGSTRRGVTWLPRAGVAWLGETWAPVGAEDDHPWTREAAAGPPSVEEPSQRPANDRERRRSRARSSATARPSAVAFATSRRQRARGRPGLRHREVFPGKLNAPPHCHSAEEEIFVVLDGDRHLLLWEENGVEEHAVRRGSIVVRPAGTGRRACVPRGRRRPDAPSSTARATRTTSASTLGRARCSSRASASSCVSASRSTTGTARTDSGGVGYRGPR